MKNVLSIQSSVVYGYAGNKAAVLPMQLLGIDVWPFYTVQFSNHTQYGQWQGMALPHGQLTQVVAGLDNLDKLGECHAVLSGYLGDQRQCEEVIHAVEQVRRHNPQALYFCDPVMGHPAKGCVVADGVDAFFRSDAIALADMMGPNMHELAMLTGRRLTTLEDTVAAARLLVKRGVKKVLVKHLGECARNPQAFEMLLVSQDAVWHIARPLYPFDKHPVGVGDLTCAILLACCLNGMTDRAALEYTANAVDAVMLQTWQLSSYELCLVEARRQIMQPEMRYVAEALWRADAAADEGGKHVFVAAHPATAAGA